MDVSVTWPRRPPRRITGCAGCRDDLETLKPLTTMTMTTKTMKPGKLMILALALVGLAVTGQGQVTNVSLTDNVSGVIPDADPLGLTRTIEVSGMTGGITNVQVSLTLEGGYNGDLYGYLSYNGQIAVLLNRVGLASTNAFGSEVAGMNVTFADGAASDIHWATGGSPLTGTWQPDGRDHQPVVRGGFV